MKSKEQSERLVPLLIEVQRELDQEISLESLASKFGSSSFHFHRMFSDAIGETPKKHIERLRLERAASLLAVTDDPVLDVCLKVGFKNPETFSRNFRKFLGYSPSGYRRMAKIAQAERLQGTDFFGSDEYRLSRARFVTMPSTPLLAMRRMGDYGVLNESFGHDDHAWNKLTRWAHERDIPSNPVLIGLFYDDPTMTPPPLQRCDVCLPVNRIVDGTQTVRCIQFDGGTYGIVEYIGRIKTIINAFRGLADEIRRSDAYVFREGPAVEFLRAANVDGVAGVHRIDACFPVKKADKRRDL
jgi:AraC family transcriptional regulator